MVVLSAPLLQTLLFVFSVSLLIFGGSATGAVSTSSKTTGVAAAATVLTAANTHGATASNIRTGETPGLSNNMIFHLVHELLGSILEQTVIGIIVICILCCLVPSSSRDESTMPKNKYGQATTMGGKSTTMGVVVSQGGTTTMGGVGLSEEDVFDEE